MIGVGCDNTVYTGPVCGREKMRARAIILPKYINVKGWKKFRTHLLSLLNMLMKHGRGHLRYST